MNRNFPYNDEYKMAYEFARVYLKANTKEEQIKIVHKIYK